eukprot:426103_1
MLASISISSLVLFVSHAALTCNRIEMTGFPIPFATFATFPEHLCMTTVQNPKNDPIIESYKVVCDGPGQTTGITNFYDNMDCSGTPTRTENLSEALTCFTGGDACAYTAIETWQGVIQCNGDQVAPDAFTNYTSTGSVFESGLCVNETYSEWSSMMVCVPNTSVTLQFWLSEGCVGAPFWSTIVAKQGCNETSSSAATVNCNAVAPNPSTAPTQQTFEPTEDPTQEPTIATAAPTTGAPTTGDPTTGTTEITNMWTETILSGAYVKEEPSDDEDMVIQKGIEYLHKQKLSVASLYAHYGDWTSSSPNYFWISYQSDFNTSTTEIIEMYSNMSKMNHNLQATGHSMKVLSNFVLCRDDLYSRGHYIVLPVICFNKIGPVTDTQSVLYSLQPIAINQNFDLQSILYDYYKPESGWQNSDVMVLITYYGISITHDALSERICTLYQKTPALPFFPNAIRGCTIRDTAGTMRYEGTLTYRYRDVHDLLADVGYPRQWKETFEGYYVHGADYVYYLGQVSAICYNQGIYDGLLNGNVSTTSTSQPTESTESTSFDDKLTQTKRDDTWKIVSIVFVIAFAVALFVLIALIVRLNRSHGDSVQIHDETKTIGGKKYVQTSTHDM